MTFLGLIPKLTERAWQGQVLTLAKVFHWRAWHDNATNAPRRCPKCRAEIHLPRNEAGWPDLFLLRGDTLIVAELKADRNYPTSEQREWLDAFRAIRRVVVAVWKPRDAEKVTQALAATEEV